MHRYVLRWLCTCAICVDVHFTITLKLADSRAWTAAVRVVSQCRRVSCCYTTNIYYKSSFYSKLDNIFSTSMSSFKLYVKQPNSSVYDTWQPMSLTPDDLKMSQAYNEACSNMYDLFMIQLIRNKWIEHMSGLRKEFSAGSVRDVCSNPTDLSLHTAKFSATNTRTSPARRNISLSGSRALACTSWRNFWLSRATLTCTAWTRQLLLVELIVIGADGWYCELAL